MCLSIYQDFSTHVGLVVWDTIHIFKRMGRLSVICMILKQFLRNIDSSVDYTFPLYAYYPYTSKISFIYLFFNQVQSWREKKKGIVFLNPACSPRGQCKRLEESVFWDVQSPAMRRNPPPGSSAVSKGWVPWQFNLTSCGHLLIMRSHWFYSKPMRNCYEYLFRKWDQTFNKFVC